MNQLLVETGNVRIYLTKNMNMMCYQTFRRGFQILCVGFMMLVFYMCLGRYNKNEDTSNVDYQWYHQDEKDIYPTISICFYGVPFVFSDEKLKKINTNFNADLYSKFLQGKYWDEEMLKVNYDSVSLEFLDHIEMIRIARNDGITKDWAKNKMVSLINGYSLTNKTSELIFSHVLLAN